MKNREIHGKDNVWSTTERLKTIQGLDVGFEWYY